MTRISLKEAKRLGILDQLEKQARKSKYKNMKIEIDGINFDSVKEGNRYMELRLLLQAGEISELELQPEYLLLEGCQGKDGAKIRPITYRADFRYRDKDGRLVVEDVKASRSFQTEVYKLKKKLLLARYSNINFREVY